MNNFKIINIADKNEWDKILSSNYHFSGQTWDYNYLQKIISKLQTNLLYFENDGEKYFFPYHTKIFNKSKFIFSPKGYTGFNRSLTRRAYKELLIKLKKTGFMTAFINLSPFTNSLEQEKLLGHFKKNNSYIIDMNYSHEKIREKYKKNISKNIAKAEKEGFTVRKYEKNDFEKVNKIFLKSIKHFNLSDGNKIDVSTASFLLNEMRNKICLVAVKDNEIYSAIFFLIGTDTCEYFINVSKNKFNYLSSFLIDKSYDYLKVIGIKKINLGGSVEEKPGIEQYKRSFKSKCVPFNCLKIIINEIEYKLNCKEGSKFPTFKTNE